MSKILISLIAIGGLYVALETDLLGNVFNPCAEPLTYSIGTFDNRFNISEADFLKALAEAEAVWEKPIGKELFAYQAEQADIPINLIYDYRQETTSTLKDIGSAVEQDEASYKQLQQRYEELKSKYERARDIYGARVSDFNTKNDLYDAMVVEWNNGPKTSQSKYKELEARRTELQREAAELKVLESGLNQVVREINTLVDTLNRLAHKLNLNVETYNTIGARRGESYTGGIYYSSQGEAGIDIFEFSSYSKLVRVLAHELGHAIGLEHGEDQKGIMYYLNEGGASTATQSDLLALKTLCRLE